MPLTKPLLLIAALTILTTPAIAAMPDASIPPIQEVASAAPTGEAFGAAKRGTPLVLTSADEASKYFGEEALAALEDAVDFEKQTVLLFAWRGSGQDKLNYVVAESFPEQITFSIQPGRTRDLRSHVKVFALRKNVKWSAGR